MLFVWNLSTLLPFFPFSGLVPLHNACSYGHYEVTELLLKVKDVLKHWLLFAFYSLTCHEFSCVVGANKSFKKIKCFLKNTTVALKMLKHSTYFKLSLKAEMKETKMLIGVSKSHSWNLQWDKCLLSFTKIQWNDRWPETVFLNPAWSLCQRYGSLAVHSTPWGCFQESCGSLLSVT